MSGVIHTADLETARKVMWNLRADAQHRADHYRVDWRTQPECEQANAIARIIGDTEE